MTRLTYQRPSRDFCLARDRKLRAAVKNKFEAFQTNAQFS